MTAPADVRDVAVVGGGVVGAALTLALASRGVDVVLIDRGAAPRPPEAGGYDLRVYALSPASAAFLESLGAWSRLAPSRVAPYTAMRVWGARMQDALGFAAADVQRGELGWIAEQDQLLWALWQSLPPARVMTGAAVAEVRSAGAAATVVLEDGRSVQARLVVAADGADSPLRERAGIDTVSWAYAQRAIVCHVKTQRAHGGVALQRFLPEGPLAFLPLPDGRSSIVWSTTDAAHLLALDDAAFCAGLGAAIGHALGEVTATTRRASFALRMLHAREYVQERFALVGDSAHVVHPLAGQGVNLGLADAAALAAEVVAAMAARRDPGSLRVLKRYERARRADNFDMVAVTDGLHRLFGIRNAGLDALLQAGMRAVDLLAPLKRPLMRRALGIG